MHLDRADHAVPAPPWHGSILRRPAHLWVAVLPQPHRDDEAQAEPAVHGPRVNRLPGGPSRLPLLRPRHQARHHVPSRHLRRDVIPVPQAGVPSMAIAHACAYGRRRHDSRTSTSRQASAANAVSEPLARRWRHPQCLSSPAHMSLPRLVIPTRSRPCPRVPRPRRHRVYLLPPRL